MPEAAIRNVSDTAFMVAEFRAVETRRRQPLFRDPWAEKLAGEHGEKIVRSLPTRAFLGGWSVVIRTCVIDDLLRTAIADGVDTILNLGAGLDTRPYRLELPKSLCWIEVDYPHVVALKEARLVGERPRCTLERVAVDLSDDRQRRQLLEATAQRSSRVLVLTEGVIPYLEEEAVATLGRELRSLPAYAGWITDYFSPVTYQYRRRKRLAQAMRNAPFRFEPKDYFDFFQRLGWAPREVRYLPIEGKRMGRPAPLPWLMRLGLLLWRPFLTREQRASFGKALGYVWFVPSDRP